MFTLQRLRFLDVLVHEEGTGSLPVLTFIDTFTNVFDDTYIGVHLANYLITNSLI